MSLDATPSGHWEITPWWLRLLGRPSFRMFYEGWSDSMMGGVPSYWEYSWEPWKESHVEND
jgi:hypothetical protein